MLLFVAAKKTGGGSSGGSGGSGGGSGGSGGSGEYMGCLNMTDEALAEHWTFWGEAPDCSYVHPTEDSDNEGDYDG